MPERWDDSGPLPIGPQGPGAGGAEQGGSGTEPPPQPRRSGGPSSPAQPLQERQRATQTHVPAQALEQQGPAGGQQAQQQGDAGYASSVSPGRLPKAGTAERTRVICVVNRKGGVGKTTTTFNLAGALTEMGKEVLVIDLDPMGSLCRSLGVYPDQLALSDLLVGADGSLGSLIRTTQLPNLYVIPGDPNLRTFEMRHGTSVVYREALGNQLSQILKWKPFHFVLIDCPPSLGLISGNAMSAAGEVIVPVDGSTYGMGALMDTMGIIRLVRKNVNEGLSVCGLLLNNVNLGTVYDRTVLEVFKRRLRQAMFKAIIPASPEADESAQLGQPVTSYAPSSWMAKAYWQLAKEVLNREPEYAI